MPYRQKHTWIFAGPQKGWTESMYIQGVSPTIDAGAAIAQDVAQARAQMLGSGLYIKAIRVQEVEAADGTKIKFSGDTLQRTPYFNPTQEQAAAPDLSILLDCFTAGSPRKHRSAYIAGFWDSVSTNFGLYTEVPAWVTAFSNWKTKIVQYGYGWVSRTPSIPYTITDYQMDQNGYVGFTVSGAPFAALIGQRVTVSVSRLPSVGGRSSLNGTLQVIPSAPGACTTVGRYGVTPFVGSGDMYLFTQTFRQIADIGIEKVVSRERGAPLLESPGRRRARART